MWPAMIAMLSGGLLARAVLWPLELRLEHRALDRTNLQLAELERDMKEDR